MTASVPAGVTAMQALRSEADVDTSFGGRFVQSIEGVSGDAGAKRDWFYFVNGIEADRGAAEYRLRPGDVLWWDYRSWAGDEMREPVVVGAFPEPFLHGYDGRVRPAAVRFETEDMRGTALGLAHLIGARSVELLSVPVGPRANTLVIVEDLPTYSFFAELRTPDGDAGSPVVFTLTFEDAKRLLKDPELAQHRYEGLRRVRPAAALAVLVALAAAALLSDHWQVPTTIAAVLLGLCLRAPASRRRPYLLGCALTAGAVFVITPFLVVNGVDVLWSGPVVPVLGQLDVTTEELAGAAIQAVRLAAVTLAFAVYALLLDHDSLLRSARFARKSALVVALATRLVPTLERDVHGLVEALRGRGVEVEGIRGRARLVSPLVSGSLERALNLAEAMEARGYGRAGATRAPSPRWRSLDRLALVAAVAVVLGALWL